MSLISAGSISLDSAFKVNKKWVYFIFEIHLHIN
jgi:hypothetical protein